MRTSQTVGKKYKNEDVVQDSFMKGKHWKLENQ